VLTLTVPHQPPSPATRDTRRKVLSSLVLMATGLGLTLLSSAFATLPAYVLILSACALVGHGSNRLFRSLPIQGLRGHRQ